MNKVRTDLKGYSHRFFIFFLGNVMVPVNKMKRNYKCHDCNTVFAVEINNSYGMYEFNRCIDCNSGKTTFEE